MEYNTMDLRRQERAMAEPAARRLLAEGVVAVLAMQEPEGGAYAVPMNYAWDGESAIYMHSAPEGHKLRCLAACPWVSLVITGAVEVLPHMFSTAYESLVVQGVITEVQAAEENSALCTCCCRNIPLITCPRGIAMPSVQRGRRLCCGSISPPGVARLTTNIENSPPIAGRGCGGGACVSS